MSMMQGTVDDSLLTEKLHDEMNAKLNKVFGQPIADDLVPVPQRERFKIFLSMHDGQRIFTRAGQVPNELHKTIEQEMDYLTKAIVEDREQWYAWDAKEKANGR